MHGRDSGLYGPTFSIRGTVKKQKFWPQLISRRGGPAVKT